MYWAGVAAFVMTGLLVAANIVERPRGSGHVALVAGMAPAFGFVIGALCMAIGREGAGGLSFYRNPTRLADGGRLPCHRVGRRRSRSPFPIAAMS